LVFSVSKEDLVKRLREAIIQGEEPSAVRAIAQELAKTDVNTVLVIENDLALAMKEVGDRFEKGTYFLTHLMLAAEAMEAATDVLTQSLAKEGAKTLEQKREKAKKILIGTVKGDIHDIGKNIVALLLKANGYSVFDLGKDVAAKTFVDEAERMGAQVIALSALLTVTRPFQTEVVNLLRDRGLREKYKVIVGGGATTDEWAEEIGADGWAADASKALKLVKQLLPD